MTLTRMPASALLCNVLAYRFACHSERAISRAAQAMNVDQGLNEKGVPV
jgi:hypothetical protein